MDSRLNQVLNVYLEGENIPLNTAYIAVYCCLEVTLPILFESWDG